MPRTYLPLWPGTALTILGAILFSWGIAHLPGCASNPLSIAQDTEQRAYAVYGTFVIVEEQAARAVQNPSIPDAVKVAIRSADARAKPTADALAQAVRDYDDASGAIKAGGSTTASLTVAATNLQKWLIEAQSDVGDLVNAVRKGK